MRERRDVVDGGSATDLSRRKLLKAAGLTALAAAAVSTGAVTVWTLRDGGDTAQRAYAFTHADDVALWIGTGERFLIRVLRGREVLEQHAGVQANQITALKSEHFIAHYIAVPGMT